MADLEWRVVCARFGQRGHSTHAWKKPTEGKAVQSVIDLDHHAQMHPGSFYASEAPYQVQSREVTEWK